MYTGTHVLHSIHSLPPTYLCRCHPHVLLSEYLHIPLIQPLGRCKDMLCSSGAAVLRRGLYVRQGLLRWELDQMHVPPNATYAVR